jgi:hypothetical protein
MPALHIIILKLTYPELISGAQGACGTWMYHQNRKA